MLTVHPLHYLYSIRLSAITKFVFFALFTLVYIYVTYNSMPTKNVRVTRGRNVTWKIRYEIPSDPKSSFTIDEQSKNGPEDLERRICPKNKKLHKYKEPKIKGIDEGGIDLYAMEEEMASRRELVTTICQRYKHTNHQPKTWQFVIDAHHSLVWCKVHKAASDTWVHYFNILGGYEERYLRKTTRNPMSLLRGKFPTPTLSQLEAALRNSLSFLIVRDPLERLLSSYLSIVEPANARYYGKLVERMRSDRQRKKGPTFPEFVRYILENREDEYWGTTSNFCSPCFINFTVIVKLETLLDDQEYILKRAGLEELLKPSKVRIHYLAHERGRTRHFLPVYYRQLDFNLLYNLVNMYQIDYDLFGYNVSKYFTYISEE